MPVVLLTGPSSDEPLSRSAAEAALKWLASAALALFQEGRDDFTLELLQEALVRAAPCEPHPETAAHGLLTRLRSTGILTGSGGDRIGTVRFLHRAFYEYLVARSCAELREPPPHHSCDPRWREVLPLAGSRLGDRAGTYLRAILDERDLLRRPLLVAARMVPEMGDRVPPAALDIRSSLASAPAALRHQVRTARTEN